MSTPFQIGDRCIGTLHPPFVIAEMSGNHTSALSGLWPSWMLQPLRVRTP
jgi:hypothetical protein